MRYYQYTPEEEAEILKFAKEWDKEHNPLCGPKAWRAFRRTHPWARKISLDGLRQKFTRLRLAAYWKEYSTTHILCPRGHAVCYVDPSNDSASNQNADVISVTNQMSAIDDGMATLYKNICIPTNGLDDMMSAEIPISVPQNGSLVASSGSNQNSAAVQEVNISKSEQMPSSNEETVLIKSLVCWHDNGKQGTKPAQENGQPATQAQHDAAVELWQTTGRSGSMLGQNTDGEQNVQPIKESEIVKRRIISHLSGNSVHADLANFKTLLLLFFATLFQEFQKETTQNSSSCKVFLQFFRKLIECLTTEFAKLV